MGLLGSIVGAVSGVGSFIQGQKQNAIAIDQFNQNMDLAKNRHQYEVRDLKAAGLNPILSANAGNQPLVGSTAGAMTDPSSKAMANIASAMQLGTLASQIKKNEAEASLASSNAKLADAHTQGYDTVLKNVEWDSEVKRAQVGNIFSQSDLNYSQVRLNNQNERLTYYKAEMALKDLQNYDVMLAAKINLMVSQAEAAVAQGQMSLAAAGYYVQAGITQIAQQGLIGAETAATFEKAAGYRLDNARKEYDNSVAKASEWTDTNPIFRNASAIGKVAQDVGKGVGSVMEGLGSFSGGVLGSLLGRR